MRSIVYRTILLATIALTAVSVSYAQRIIKGTVYREGKPAAGITVEAHKGGTFMTSFDGIYQVSADEKSKYLKFTFIDEIKKLDIEGNTSNEIDFYFDGKKPGNGNGEEAEAGVDLRSSDELMKAGNKEFMSAVSLYYEFFKQEDFNSAIPNWEVLYKKFPKSTLNIYIHGVSMYEKLLEKATTNEEKDKCLNKIIEIYDRRIKYFDQKGYVLGRKGTSWLKYNLDPARNLEGAQLKNVLKKGYDWVLESIKLQGEETETPVMVLLIQASSSLFKMGELKKENVVQDYDLCSGVINKMLADKNNTEKVKRAEEIQPYIEGLFSNSGAADCEALINIYTPQFQEKSNDIDFIKSMLRRLSKANCDESELYSQASEKLYQLEPSSEAAYNMARRFVKKGDTEKADMYYQQAISRETDNSVLENYYYEYGYFVFSRESAYQEARNYVQKALAINPNNCKALMLLGDIYVSASRSFGADDFEKATVFWLAVDCFNQARKGGEDCAADAAKKAGEYKAYFPSKEEAFFRGLSEGGSYKIGGWINASTTVRF